MADPEFYVVSARKSDSVSHSLRANFTGPDDVNLIVAKATHFEVHLLVDDAYEGTAKSLRLLLDVPVYGRISTLMKYRHQERDTDFLFISTDTYKFFVLSYNAITHQLVTEANGDIADRTGRPVDLGQIGLVDPGERMLGLHLYQGLFKVIQLSSGRKGSGHSKKGPGNRNLMELRAINLRLEELLVIAIEFLDAPEGSSHPLLAVLHQDAKGARHLKTYHVDVNAGEFKEYNELKPAHIEAGANLVIPVPNSMGGGAVVLGEEVITAISTDKIISVPMRPTIMKCWNKIDPEGSRYLLGDHMGKLYALILFAEEGVLQDLRLELLGETSQPSSITYLDSGYVYVGSHFGDSQLLQLSTERKPDGAYLTVTTEFENLAPITDFCVVDIEKQGQGQVVACCGAYKDGSLRIVRNGIGIDVVGTLNDVPELNGIWSLRPSYDTSEDSMLVLSFISETKIQAKEEDGGLAPVEDEDAGGFCLTESTLACANVINDNIVQVTASGVLLIRTSDRTLVHKWSPDQPARIRHASISPFQVVVALDEGILVHLEIEEAQLRETARTQLEHEIACINIFTESGQTEASRIGLVGLWTEISVLTIELPTMRTLDKQLLETEAIPRSVLTVKMNDVHYSFAALGDGQLFTFNLNEKTGTLRDRKKISLGNQPITLCPFRSQGQTHVFASSDRPTVIHTNSGKLLYSNVNLKEVSHMCPFNFDGEALALVTEGSLKVGTIEAIEKLHIKKVPLGESARRISHQESSRTFGLLTLKMEQSDETGDFEEATSFKLLDDQLFEQLDCFEMDKFESVQSILSTALGDDPNVYFIVGTAYVFPSEDEPTKGRILIFRVTEDRKLFLVEQLDTRGSVYCLGAVAGRLIAGVNSKIIAYTWQNPEEGQDANKSSLTETCVKHGHILVLTLVVYGEFVLIGDLMKSVSVFSFDTRTNTLQPIARDPDANWMTALAAIEDDLYIGAENYGNLFALKRQSDVEDEEERKRLQNAGRFHVGEMINRFRHGSLVMSLPDQEQVVKPTLLYGTVTGSIGVIATVDGVTARLLGDLQENLRRVVKGVGGLAYSEWRRFDNQRRVLPAEHFLDGDLIESFLDLSKEQQQAVVDGARKTADVAAAAAHVTSHPAGLQSAPAVAASSGSGHGMKKLDVSLEELIRLVEELSRIH